MKQTLKEQQQSIRELIDSDDFFFDYVYMNMNDEVFRESFTDALQSKLELMGLDEWKVTCNSRNNNAKIIESQKLVFSIKRKRTKLTFTF